LEVTTWHTTSFFVFSLVKNSNWPGATEEDKRTTAPCPNIKTVFVDSEKGSRLSLPATARAPFTVTPTSRATGWGREESVCEVVAEPATGRAAAFSGMDVNISFSFAVGDMGTLARTNSPARTEKVFARNHPMV
jgi:hypothetical protein